MQPQTKSFFGTIQRIRFWYVLLLFLGGIFVVRLFYLQVIKHDYYEKSAAFSQLKQYDIPAARGIIKAKSGDKVVPLVLNETLFTLFADPKYVKDPSDAAEKLQKAIGGNESEYEDKIKDPDSPRYTILAKRLSREQHETIEKLKLKGIGTREAQYRTYPDGKIAAQLLGFVNDDGEGKYGLEEALNDELNGTAGKLKAITDASGVPLAANKDNVVIAPKQGQQVTLTIDIGVQQQLEGILKQGLDAAKSKSGSALIMDANSGAIRAMASYPTFNPAEYFKTSNAAAFNNTNVSSPLEVGSIMKPLTAAAAMDIGVVGANTSYYDPSYYRIDDATVRNIEEDGGAAQRTTTDVLKYSLNTGATWLLMQMGGGTINEQARIRWHDYMTNHYMFGKKTGIEQGYEAEGIIPHPTDGFGLNITYANTAFGQGMTATPVQMGAAFAAILNGGTYYKPRLIDATTDTTGQDIKRQPEIIKKDAVSPEVSRNLVSMLETTYQHNRVVYGAGPIRPEYSVGGKTGTAQITRPEGGYYEDQFNGMYVGFIGGDKPEYVIVVRVDKPAIAGYAGSKAAAPIFVKLANMMIDSYGVTPRSN
jgi:stage V sporulation protein D (sporulation-specific penicillin-binding protein)